MKERELSNEMDVIYLAGGCFWCTEAIYESVNGVISVVPGYMGGTAETADYETVCTGLTSHAECVQIKYNQSILTLEEVLEIFFATHDPTTLNCQGNDMGPQYRSVVFYTTDRQREIAQHYIAQLEVQEAFDLPIVTDVQPATEFYVAESYHHTYFKRNPLQPYCYYVIRPKVEKMRTLYAHRLAE